jgi:hypothetical protein
MRSRHVLAAISLAAGIAGLHAAHGGCGGPTCTDTGVCQECVPACKATWDEKKSSKPTYTMKCEYACVRGRDPWHAPPPECRSCPPCGDVIVKKKAYKTPGKEKVEKVPKYEVTMVPADPCACADCRGDQQVCWWNPLRLVACLKCW